MVLKEGRKTNAAFWAFESALGQAAESEGRRSTLLIRGKTSPFTIFTKIDDSIEANYWGGGGGGGGGGEGRRALLSGEESHLQDTTFWGLWVGGVRG